MSDAIGSSAPAFITAAALLPAAGCGALLLLLDRRRRAQWQPLLASLLWGGTVGALGAQALNDAALRVFPRQLVWGLIAPLVEEIAKGSALLVVLLVWRDSLRGVRAGIVYGSLAGLGFAATENLGYYTLAAIQGGTAGLARALYLRGLLQGLNHAAFTAILGAAVGCARTEAPARHRIPTVLGGLAVAVAVHAAWNWFASPAITAILCNAPSPAAACAPAPNPTDLLVSVPALVVAFIGPVAVLLMALAWRGDRGQRSRQRRT